jgi:hypothetical protein
MALITDFKTMPSGGKIHPTSVIGHVKAFSGPDRAPIVQIDTYGSNDRQMPNTTSQTIQLDVTAARKLHRFLEETYGFGAQRKI